MESWQVDHITRYLHLLIEHTIRSYELYAYLQSAGVITASEVEEIKSKKISAAKAYHLYSILETRTDGYRSVIKALHKTKQTGAVNVLLLGYPLHKIQNCKIIFFGNEHKLSDILHDRQIEKVVDKMRKTFTVDEYLDMIECTDNAVPLISNTIPPVNPYYVPRFLTKQNGIQTAVFEAQSPDVFVVKNEDLKHLQAAIGDIRIGSSTEQLRKITAKLIVLDLDDDWPRLKANANVPLHLVNYDAEEGSFFLVETTGGSEMLHRFLHSGKHGSLHKRINEVDIFNTNEQHPVKCICISDSPGMGKSSILANLARKSISMFPEKIVGFINLSHVHEILNKPISEKPHTWKQVLSNLLADSPFSAAVLQEIFEANKYHFELFFDALDEVQNEQFDLVKHMLEDYILVIPNAKIYMTSRKHVRHMLESMCNVLAYDIEPFTRETQIEFLMSIWSSQLPEYSLEKLEQFTKLTLNSINERLNEEERSITGIPLQCRLIADVLAADAQTYCNPRRQKEIEPRLFTGTLPELYQRYFHIKLGDNSCMLRCIFVNKQAGCQTCAKFCVHVRFALREVFDMPVSELDQCLPVTQEDTEMVLSIGIVERSGCVKNGSLTFLHRTLAEYLAAVFVSSSLCADIKSSNIPERFWKMLYNKALHSFVQSNHSDDFEYNDQSDDFEYNDQSGDFEYNDQSDYFEYNVVTYFVESYFVQHEHNSVYQCFRNPLFIPTSSEKFYKTLVLLCTNSYNSILQLIYDTTPEVAFWTKFFIRIHLTGNRAALLHKCAHSFKLTAIEIMFKLLNNRFGVELDHVCLRKYENKTPLEVAAHRGNIDAVKFFLEKPHNPLGNILHELAQQSSVRCRGDEEFACRVEIVKLLIQKHPELVNTLESILQVNYVHVKLVKCFIEAGANIQVNPHNTPFLSFAINWIADRPSRTTKCDYLELCEFLIFDRKAFDLFNSNLEGRDNIYVNIFYARFLGFEVVLKIFKMLEQASSDPTFPKELSLPIEARKVCNFKDMIHSHHLNSKGKSTASHSLRQMKSLCKEDASYLKNLIFSGQNSNINVFDCVLFDPEDIFEENTVDILEEDQFAHNVFHYLAIFGKHVEVFRIAKYIVSHWSKVVLKTASQPTTPMQLFTAISCEGNTILHYAGIWKNMTCEDLDWILMGGRSAVWDEKLVCLGLNTRNDQGYTPVNIAVLGNNDIKLWEHMLLRGASFLVKHEHGHNLVHAYCYYMTFRIAKDINWLDKIVKLIKLGVDVMNATVLETTFCSMC